MRFIKILFLITIGISFIVLALANREPVTLRLLPESMAPYFVNLPDISTPLFIPVFGGVMIGLLIGFFWEWMREHRHRAKSSERKRRADKLQAELKDLRKKGDGKDDVLALLDD